MKLDKGQKVTAGASVLTAAASVMVWGLGLLGVEIDYAAASGLLVLSVVAGGAITDWLTEDDESGQ